VTQLLEHPALIFADGPVPPAPSPGEEDAAKGRGGQ
jgi:hypothetical protein